MPVVSRLSMVPVKGAALHHPERLRLTLSGTSGDRRFYLIDAQGRLFSGKQHGPLVQVRAEVDGSRLCLRFPDGSVVEGTAALGEPVHTSFWGRIVDGYVVRTALGRAERIRRRTGHPGRCRSTG